MRKILAAVLLSIAVLVTGCSANESVTVFDNSSLSAGLISTPESNFENTHVIPNNSLNSTTTSTVVPEPIIESTESIQKQEDDNSQSSTETVKSDNEISVAQSTISSSSSVSQPPQNIPEQSYVMTSSTTELIQSNEEEPIGSTPESQSTSSIPVSLPVETDFKTEPTEDNRMKTLVVYFSCTNTTKTLAEYASDILDADIYEIVPAEPYTEADLAYYTNGRADREQSDPSIRPAISGGVDNMSDYDTIILGYPIWHGQAPRIISTFLEGYDFSEKTIIPFCTSHSSGMGSSADNLHTLCAANWLNGKRFGSGATKSELENWLKQYNIS